MTLSDILGYPQVNISEHPRATRSHRCGIYKDGIPRYEPPKTRKPTHSTSTRDHTGLTAAQRKILAIINKSSVPMGAVEVAKIMKYGPTSVSSNLTTLWRQRLLDRKKLKDGKVRWYVYFPMP